MSKEILLVVDAVSNEKGVGKSIIFESTSTKLKKTIVTVQELLVAYLCQYCSLFFPIGLILLA